MGKILMPRRQFALMAGAGILSGCAAGSTPLQPKLLHAESGPICRVNPDGSVSCGGNSPGVTLLSRVESAQGLTAQHYQQAGVNKFSLVTQMKSKPYSNHVIQGHLNASTWGGQEWSSGAGRVPSPFTLDIPNNLVVGDNLTQGGVSVPITSTGSTSCSFKHSSGVTWTLTATHVSGGYQIDVQGSNGHSYSDTVYPTQAGDLKIKPPTRVASFGATDNLEVANLQCTVDILEVILAALLLDIALLALLIPGFDILDIVGVVACLVLYERNLWKMYSDGCFDFQW